nr:unnamed protein product [Callosobruchus analis]
MGKLTGNGIESLKSLIILTFPIIIILYESPNSEYEETSEAPASLNSSSGSSKYNITWSGDETRLLLDKYKQYLSLVGQMKKFKNKKLMWIQISKDSKNQFDIERTPQQTENRYKTILKRDSIR